MLSEHHIPADDGRPPTQAEIYRKEVDEAAAKFQRCLEDISRRSVLGGTREMAIAMTKLQEATMWAKAHIEAYA